MKVVANSSVLISLSAINQLDLLKHRFHDGVAIPRAVWREVVETGEGQIGSEKVRSSKWIKVIDVKDSNFVNLLRVELDEGEAEAITLFREIQADIILLDEKDGRKIARRLGQKVLGTVGILLWAKKNGKIDSLEEHLNLLQRNGKFRLGNAVYQRALEIAGEVKH